MQQVGLGYRCAHYQMWTMDALIISSSINNMIMMMMIIIIIMIIILNININII